MLHWACETLREPVGGGAGPSPHFMVFRSHLDVKKHILDVEIKSKRTFNLHKSERNPCEHCSDYNIYHLCNNV